MSGNGVPSVPVLIIGAGPAGLTTAITLAHQGIGSLLIERRADPSDQPRATMISTRSMELFRSWGLESRVRAGSVDVASAAWLTHTLATAQGSAMPLGLPDRALATAVSPTGPTWAPQDHLEPVLLAHLRTRRLARVWYATELVALEQAHDGVRATLHDRAGGTNTTVSARFVVAADGAHSTARDALGISMHGPDHLIECLTALFVAPLWDVVGERRYGLYAVGHAEAEGIFVPAGGDRWLYRWHWEPSRERVADYPADRVIRLIRLGAGVPGLAPQLVHLGAFSFATQVADRFRDRNAFLAGDAAHRVTPRGGTGMNTAIHDGYDLGWKLAWTLHGWAGPELLDTYEAERRPIAVANLTRSVPEEREASEGLAIDLHGRLPHAWLPGANGLISTLDLLGPGLTLLTDRAGQAWHAAADAVRTLVPLARHALDDATAAAVGIEPGAALLVRPDARIASRWDSEPTDTVELLHTGLQQATGSAPSSVHAAVVGVSSS